MSPEPRAASRAPPPHSLEASELLEDHSVDPQRGLSRRDVATRRREHGPNRLRTVEPVSAWRVLWNQTKSLIVLLLAVAALLSAAFGDYTEAAAIVAVLAINTMIGFVTELRAARSMEALRQLGGIRARVVRDGSEALVTAQELVPGDIVLIEGGDVVTADLRLLEASKLEADESVLTGESLPVGKSCELLPPADAGVADRHNMLHKGTSVTRGSARALVVATGMSTELGKIAALVAAAEDEPTPLEIRLERLGRKLVVVAFAVAGIASGAGILSGQDVRLMVETGVALAVAAIPEGLPVVATMALARGMLRLARRNAHIRRLAAVETLGATNVILVDKTGTLTENRMTVSRLLLPGEADQVQVGGEGLSLSGSFDAGARVISVGESPALRTALEIGALCVNASLVESEGEVAALGDPLEVALLVAAEKGGVRREELVALLPEIREEAFDATSKMMATFHRDGDRVRVAVKGAPEAVVAACVGAGTNGEAIPLDEAARRDWLRRGAALAADGLRVIALAERFVTEGDALPYEDLRLVGIVGMLDPPRAGVPEAIAACHHAGIRVVMATGDQPLTASSIARTVGLVEGEDAPVVRGDELSEVLANPDRLAATDVFARVDPAQKLELVDALQASGAIVAMTGDGVNDAPALQKADIGVAMGQRGTQVAREAADMVLRDDSMASIVVAVRQGRVIFGNIRQFVLYLLSCNVAEIGVITIAASIGLPLPLLPLQILFLNLVTDVFPALALGFGEGDPRTMKRPPRDPREPFLTRRHWLLIATHGAVLTGSVLAALFIAIGPLRYDTDRAITVSFLTIGFAQLWHVFNVRAPDSTFLGNNVIRNPWVWGALILCSGLLLGTVTLPGLRAVLGVVPPDSTGWGLILGLSVIPWCLGQLAHPFVARRLDRPGP